MSEQNQNPEMTRRGLLGGAAVAAAALGGAAMAAEDGHGGHGDHSEHESHGSVETGPHNVAVVEAATACVSAAEACLAHCLALLGAGDRSIAGCARSVSETLPVAHAMTRLAAMDAKRLKLFALVAIDFFKDCEVECRRHAEHHAQCKSCMEACVALIRASETMIET